MCLKLPPETEDVEPDGTWFWSWGGRPSATTGTFDVLLKLNVNEKKGIQDETL